MVITTVSTDDTMLQCNQKNGDNIDKSENATMGTSSEPVYGDVSVGFEGRSGNDSCYEVDNGQV